MEGNSPVNHWAKELMGKILGGTEWTFQEICIQKPGRVAVWPKHGLGLEGKACECVETLGVGSELQAGSGWIKGSFKHLGGDRDLERTEIGAYKGRETT